MDSNEDEEVAQAEAEVAAARRSMRTPAESARLTVLIRAVLWFSSATLLTAASCYVRFRVRRQPKAKEG